MNQEEYDSKFETKDKESKKLKAAFEQVSDIRKFEIELYWKRAGYFWALIAVAFAGYFAILSSEHIPNKLFLSFIVASIGLVFTFAWHLVNRGSKYWQENWENHLDLLENEVTGPLYKTLLERPVHDNFYEEYVTGPLSVSVSKINQWVSVFVIFIWLSLGVYSAYKTISKLSINFGEWLIIGSHIVVIIATGVICYMMIQRGKTHKGEHNPNVVERTTKINN
ncbi:hypothetical protein DJ030_09995 [bacterium endosymbiont of Escarpia laminata]|nr:MAG: hypothetical protein DJ030_09995 [bacterium endosymbiont of Escarpia laminata]